LGLTSPPSRLLPQSSVLCSAKTTASPSRVASLLARFPIPLSSPICFVFLTARWQEWKILSAPGLCCVRTAVVRFVSNEELAVLSSSQATPVRTCPDRSLRWCRDVCHNTPGLLPSSRSKLSAFPVTITGYPYFPYGPRIYTFRRSVTRPTHSLHLASYTPYWLCTQVHYRQGGYSRLVGFARFPARTHWVTSTSFTTSLPIPRFWI